jgi:HPt (histidine-containing phosphotransfer) domain-containing protein
MLEKWAPSARRFDSGAGASSAPAAEASEHEKSSVATRGETSPRSAEGSLLDPTTSRSDRMWELFVQHSRDDIEFIQEAAAVGDAESLRLRAHRMKGSSYAFGARPLGDKAADIERHAISGNLNVDGELDDLISLFKQTSALMPQQARRAARAG